MDSKSVWKDIEKIRETGVLVHNITNYVVMNTSANALLALGASPVMAHAREEVEEIVKISGALVINIGTLDGPWIESMLLAGKAARALKKPIVLDPVGAGASTLRTETARRLLDEVHPSVIRGNGSEIRALHHADSRTKGVDSSHSADDAQEAALALSRDYGCVVSISGVKDLILQGNKRIHISNGHSLMPKVTGLGCTATALTGAFLAVNPDPLAAAAHAMAVMGVAGELAGLTAPGPGTLQLHFLDALYNLSEHDLDSRLKMEVNTD